MPSKGQLVGTVLGGKYRLDSILGLGGMGEVYRATQISLGRPVAIKVIAHTSRRADDAERFRREALTVSRLRSPFTVTLYDFGEEESLLYMVMELLMGETLRARLQRDPQPGVGFTLELASQALQSLDEAHREGILHRDIKPENLFLVAPVSQIGSGSGPRGASGLWIKLLDFGLAKIVGSGDVLTRAGEMMGTPGYMSPEQLRARGLTATSDLYSLACVLYESLTGRRAFEFAEALDGKLPSPPAELFPATPKELSDQIMAALSADPAQRPPSTTLWLQVIEGLRAPMISPDASRTVQSGPRGAAPPVANEADTVHSMAPKGRGRPLLVGLSVAVFAIAGGVGLALFRSQQSTAIPLPAEGVVPARLPEQASPPLPTPPRASPVDTVKPAPVADPVKADAPKSPPPTASPASAPEAPEHATVRKTAHPPSPAGRAIKERFVRIKTAWEVERTHRGSADRKIFDLMLKSIQADIARNKDVKADLDNFVNDALRGEEP